MGISDSVLHQIERSFEKVDVIEDEEQIQDEEQVQEEEEVEEENVEQEQVAEEIESVEDEQNSELFQSQLTQLKNMGFGDEDANARLLKQHNGDVLSVVQDLLADDD